MLHTEITPCKRRHAASEPTQREGDNKPEKIIYSIIKKIRRRSGNSVSIDDSRSALLAALPGVLEKQSWRSSLGEALHEIGEK